MKTWTRPTVDEMDIKATANEPTTEFAVDDVQPGEDGRLRGKRGKKSGSGPVSTFEYYPN